MALYRIKYGDVFEIKTEKGVAYFQCVEEAPATECETIRILPGVFDDITNVDIKTLVEMRESYFVQFALKYAVKKKCVKPIGNYKVPEFVSVPIYYRDKHIIRGKFVCWHIVNKKTLQRHSVNVLSESEKRLSQWGVWNDTLLAERIADGWNLEDWI